MHWPHRQLIQRGEITIEELADIVARAPKLCRCGNSYFGKQCTAEARHEHIKAEIERRFKRGDRVYYNMWAYAANSTARVTGFPKDPRLWGWINVKLDK